MENAAAAVSVPVAQPTNPTPPAAADVSAKSNEGANAAPKAPEKIKVVVNGRTKFFTQDELVQRAALADGSYDRLEEANKLVKSIQSRDQRFKETPEEIFDFMTKDLGHDPDRIRAAIEKYYRSRFIDPENMTPEEKRIAELEAKNKEYESKEEKEKTDKKSRADKEEYEKEFQGTQKELFEAMEKGGLARDKFNLSRCAYHYRNMAMKGIDPTPERVAMKVNEEFDRIHQHRIERCKSPEEVAALLGPKVIQMVRDYDIAQLERDKLPGSQRPSKPVQRRQQREKERPHLNAFSVWNE